MDPLSAIREFGGMGLAAYVVFWMTRKFNGKLDSNTTTLREATEAIRALRDAIERVNWRP
jgi:hypothetical protein